ncbi:carbamoyltransferase C-terminal domain-containing protein [Maricaulis sp.]|uniref:carbamoyltransferase family protein n=1 Tax=Maricaulis sp. TaxID=1486257 RepID=UPI002624D856|nr:carbamoyltransferase C-terminal domain-containing protein [Maricaulis sp.]
MKWYVGLSNTGHDPALAIIDPDGRVAFAEATERFVQVKRAWGILPDLAAHLEHAIAHVDFDPARDQIEVCTSWSTTHKRPKDELTNPLMARHMLDSLYDYQGCQFNNIGASFRLLELTDQPIEVRRFEHHACHAATGVYFSSAEDAVCLVIDGEGETGAISEYAVSGRRLKRRWRAWNAGASLGLYYGWLTLRCGFDGIKGEEWKVMGLAAFGEVRDDLVAELSRVLAFENHRPVNRDDEEISAILSEVETRIAHATRTPQEPIMQAADLAASGQYVYGRFADNLIAGCMKHEPSSLILTGGCALNSSYNGTVMQRFGLDQVDIPPCPADDGNAIGAALLAWCEDQDAPIARSDRSPYLGSSPNPAKIAACIEASAPHFKVSEAGENSANLVARKLAEGQIIGVMRGRAEFGPRALGNRSILADPRPAGMKDKINRLVKGREAYRPFAPVIPEDRLADWFETPQPTPYMSKTLRWRPDKLTQIPAVAHADDTGRAQSVTPELYPWLHDVLVAFEAETGVPIILNTSLNIMGKPIVHSVEDTVAMLMTTGLDAILLGDTLIEKASR